jgi:hypothetical protein
MCLIFATLVAYKKRDRLPLEGELLAALKVRYLKQGMKGRGCVSEVESRIYSWSIDF